MTNREFFDILVISGKINNVKTENIDVLYDSKIYVGDLGKLVMNRSMTMFIQVMRICDRIIRIYNDDNKSEQAINKLKYLIDAYLKFLRNKNVLQMLRNIILFISYIAQGGELELIDYIEFCKLVQLVNKDYLIDKDEKHSLRQEWILDLSEFIVDEIFTTPLIKIDGGKIEYFKTDDIPNSKLRVNKIKELLKDESIDLIITPYDEYESKLLIKGIGLEEWFKKKLKILVRNNKN